MLSIFNNGGGGGPTNLCALFRIEKSVKLNDESTSEFSFSKFEHKLILLIIMIITENLFLLTMAHLK